jgi:hypothetical protein
MKKILLATFLFTNMFLSAQIKTDTTKKVVFVDYDFYKFNNDEINLRLNKIEKFGNLHRTGNHLMISGTLLSGISSLILSRNSIEKYGNNYYYADYNSAYKKYKRTERLGFTILGIGSALATAGIIVNLDSFRQFRKKQY